LGISGVFLLRFQACPKSTSLRLKAGLSVPREDPSVYSETQAPRQEAGKGTKRMEKQARTETSPCYSGLIRYQYPPHNATVFMINLPGLLPRLALSYMDRWVKPSQTGLKSVAQETTPYLGINNLATGGLDCAGQQAECRPIIWLAH
jgi:hypothetical protein